MKINYIILIGSIVIISLVVYYTTTYENFIVFNRSTRQQFSECSTITNCATCAETFGCTYCKTSNKCVRDVSKNALCPREDTASSRFGCGPDNSTAGSLNRRRLYGDCSGAADCKDCLGSPGCYWCDTKKVCISNIGVYDTCKDDPVIKNSLSQCDVNNNQRYNPNEFTIERTMTSLPAATSERSTNLLNTTNNRPSSSAISLADTMSSIIPIVALSKDINGNLSDSSLLTVIDSMKRDGYNFSTNAGKQNALQVIETQKNQLRQNYKVNIKEYVSNSIDYVSDGTSLNRAKDIDIKIKELDDLSRYIKTMKIEGFIEGFLDDRLSREKTINENLMEENGLSKILVQMLWLANIVALGTFLYIR